MSLQVEEVSPGDFQDIDEYVEELEDAGLDASYENIVDGFGFVAVLTVEGRQHAVFENSPTGQTGHLVRSVKTRLYEIIPR